MYGFLNATASASTTLVIDVLSEMSDPATLTVIEIIPDSSQRPVWGDTCEFSLMDSDGVTVLKELGSVAVDPLEKTSLPNSQYSSLTSGQKIRAIYTSVAPLIGAKVAINVNAVT